MIGIGGIASYIPKQTIDNICRAKTFGESPQFLNDRLGPLYLPIKSKDEDTSDMAAKAIHALATKYNMALDEIDALIVCTQNPDGNGLPHTAAITQKKADLPTSVAAFDISLGCSGYVYGLHIAKGFMESAGLQKGILITADPYSKIIDENDRATSMLFGDASTATLLSTTPKYYIKQSIFETDGTGSSYIINKNGTFHMNGRQVFNFVATTIPKQIKNLLEKAGYTLNDISLFLLHQGSKFIVETLQKKLNLPTEKVPVCLSKTGNTVSSSIPLILEEYLETEIDRILLSGFGVGLSCGSVIIEKNERL